ncbi:phosphotyrosine-specific ptp2-like protein [Coemansia erecta]|uniref:protein-tyrosine-phosphatase n=1 Tax=Coemansia erecta TaxID=147472 RepID=A0A9W8CSZ1_9FUNG|nr:phosphotyrosine-specific ptp2-like protein [Coemansia erecta]
MGLHLDTSSAATTVGGSDGPPPPPTARGTWTMNALSMPPATPLVMSMPMTPMGQKAPMTPMIPSMLTPSVIPSGPGTPSEGTEVLGLFSRTNGLSRKPEVREVPATTVKGLDFASPCELSQFLDTKSCGLLVDVRPSADFAAGHISTAVSVTAPTTLVRRKAFSIERLLTMAGAPGEVAASWKKCTWVVIYGAGTPEDTASEDTPLVLLARKFAAEAPRDCRICVLRGGYTEFVREKESLCSSKPEAQGVAPEKAAVSAAAPKTVPADHPMLRSMRQAPGGAGFDSVNVVPLRLPPNRINIETLPSYLRRATGSPGAQYLHQLFASVDSSESQRMSSMIGSNGMVTSKNKYTIAAGLELGAKNRYNNIFPFDSNRVRLSSSDDYINASYVAYFDGPVYIATQGPLPATVPDFWQMAWDHRVRVIVMLTREFENGREKCHRYWPQSLGATAVFGSMRVEFQAEARHPDDATIISRRLRVSPVASPNDSMVITQLQYETWPDHGAPETPLGVLRLRELARAAQGDDEESKRIPMIVHCSAGCGRTGAFCVVDTVLSMGIKSLAEISPVAASAPPGMQMLPVGEGYDPHAKFTGLIPQALRSKSSNAALAVTAATTANSIVGSDVTSATADTAEKPDSGEDMDVAKSRSDLRASRSLSRWIELPNAEFHEDLVYMIVSRFRELRVSMVQTNSQFVFCHEALTWAAMGAGPRSLSRVLDRRLVAEWNRANYPALTEADYFDLTYQLRGRQEMLHAMLSSDASSAGTTDSNSAMGTVSTGSGRASIDVASGNLSANGRPSVTAPPLVKRSNTVGPARRGFFGSIFSPTGESTGDSGSSGSQKGGKSQQSLAAPPLMKAAFSSDARLGVRNAPKPAVIAEEDETLTNAEMEVDSEMTSDDVAEMILAPPDTGPSTESDQTTEPEPITDSEQQMAAGPHVLVLGSSTGTVPAAATMAPGAGLVAANANPGFQKPQRLALRRPPGLSLPFTSSTTPAAPTVPLPAIPLPALPTSTRIDPAPANGEHPEIVTDYFGCVQGEISANTSTNGGSNGSNANPVEFNFAFNDDASGMLNMFVGPPTSNAADWRRSVLGHLDASGEFSPVHHAAAAAAAASAGFGSASNTAPASPSTANAYVGNPALASPRVK